MWLFLITQLVASSLAYAAEDRPVVWTRGFTRSLPTVFSADNYRTLERSDEDIELRREGYLPPHQRDALFKKVQLKLSDFDQMEKDILVLRAHEYTLPELQKFYPNLPLVQLRKLKVEVDRIAQN
jgi:hypothetical protein